MQALPFASASDHADAIRRGEVLCIELVDLYNDRIRQYNPRLHAIVIGNEADAARTARERDDDVRRHRIRGPLHGVPVTVKEAFDVAGLKTTVNLRRLRNNVATIDAFVVRKLREAGAAILGKTNVPAMLGDYQSAGPLYATANNPYDLTRTPGGSTGGGAAAIAAGLTALEIGSDLAGSIRVPAHFCGVFALKPTDNAALHGRGHVPRLAAGPVTMACIGPLARTMTDIDLAWSVISGSTPPHLRPDELRPSKQLADYRIAWTDRAGPVTCGDQTKHALEAFVRTLQAGGVGADRWRPDEQWLNVAYDVWGILCGSLIGQDASWITRQQMKYQFHATARGSTMTVVPGWKAGLALRPAAVARALARRADLVRDLQRRFETCDFIIGPVAVGPAFPHNRRHSPISLEGLTVPYLDYAMPFTVPYNVSGNPALVVPVVQSLEGLPIGIQIVGPHHAESELIRFGRLIEQLGLTCMTPRGYDRN